MRSPLAVILVLASLAPAQALQGSLRISYVTLSTSPDTQTDAYGAATAPANVSGVVSVAASVSGAAKVELWADGVLLQTLAAAPYTFTWNSGSVANGAHTLAVKGYDSGGAVVSQSIPLTITNAAAALYSVSGTVRSPQGFGVAGVTITAGGNTAVSGADGAYSLLALPAGTYSVYASKPDYLLNPAVQSVTVGGNVTGIDWTATYVPPPDTTPPAVAILSPLSGAHVQTNNRPNFAVTVAATDDSGIAQVELWLDGRLLATDTAAPWAITVNYKKWGTEAHTLQAKAKDGAGNVGASAIVTVYR